MKTTHDIKGSQTLSDEDKSSFIVKLMEEMFGKLKEHAFIIIIVLIVMYCQDKMYDKKSAEYRKIISDKEKLMIKHHNDEMAIIYKFTNEEKAILKEKTIISVPEIQHHTTIIREVPTSTKESSKKKKYWLFNRY